MNHKSLFISLLGLLLGLSTFAQSPEKIIPYLQIQPGFALIVNNADGFQRGLFRQLGGVQAGFGIGYKKEDYTLSTELLVRASGGRGEEVNFIDLNGFRVGTVSGAHFEYGVRLNLIYTKYWNGFLLGTGLGGEYVRSEETMGLLAASINYFQPLRVFFPVRAGFRRGKFEGFLQMETNLSNLSRANISGFRMQTLGLYLGIRYDIRTSTKGNE